MYNLNKKQLPLLFFIDLQIYKIDAKSKLDEIGFEHDNGRTSNL